MLTKEREEQIRAKVLLAQEYESGNIVYRDQKVLLEEIDRLRIHKTLISQASDEQSEGIKKLLKERDQLLAENEQFRRDYDKHDLILERDKLREEVSEWKGTHAHLQTEASITINGLEQENERLREQIEMEIRVRTQNCTQVKRGG